MNTRDKIAFVLYMIVAVLSLIFGIRYLFCDTIMPYHQQAIGMTWLELEPGLQSLLNGLIKVAASAFFIVGISSIILLVVPYRRDEVWAKLTVPVIQIIFSLFILYASLNIAVQTQASTPWPVSAFTLTLTVMAFLISKKSSISNLKSEELIY